MYSRVLERSLELIVKPLMQEKLRSFCLGCGTVYQILTLPCGELKDAWEFDHAICMCYVDLQKVFSLCPCGFCRVAEGGLGY